MHLFREITEDDFEDIYSLALKAHAGITSLPKNRSLIEEKIAKAVSKEGLYFFGLVDLNQKKLIGVSAIKTNGGKTHPFNYYKIQKEERRRTRLLIPEKENRLFSELSSLFLLKNERHYGTGRLLSLSRFLF